MRVSVVILSERVATVTDMTSTQLQRLIDDQHGLVTRPQIARLGYSRKRIDFLVESRQWQRVLHGVYSVTTGPLDRRMTLVAALLYGGESAILSHDSAAEEWGMIGVDAGRPVHVTVRYGLSAMNQPPTYRRGGARLTPLIGAVLHPGVRVHRSRAIAHIRVESALPRTTRADTALDMAVASPTPTEAVDTLVSAVTHSGVKLLDIQRRLAERPPHRYGNAIAGAVALLADGVQSILEFRYATDVEQAHGLPAARRQGEVVVDGHTLYEDVTYRIDEHEVIVRLDGREAHSVSAIAFRDRRRENAAELAGKSSLVYGWDEVDREPCEVAAEVRVVLQRHGWDGPNPCVRCKNPDQDCARFTPAGPGKTALPT